MSYSVSQRTSEIGLRMALGAKPAQVLFMVERQGLLLVALGVLLGGAAAVLLTRLMTGLLFHVPPADGITFTAVPLLLACVSLLACYLPARRATQVDPVQALHCE
ncbi:MAG: FtsX-like permease family protein [Acidobacteriaceae bacterium]|nr:FtsX-like permease family protein [Acidobacteriaceae bacterium]